VSPKTGRRLGDVAEICCNGGQEFDTTRIDPGQTHYAHLAYAAYIYSLDKSIGAVIDKVTDLGKMEETIFLFASDNGATSRGVNTPLRGGKHSLWEGGVHVPAAIWWPGTFDRNTAPYSPHTNTYDGLIAYIDLYPTLMSMSGQPCLATNLDGLDCWAHLQQRTECRPGTDEALFWMWLDHGTVRTRQWKLYYSESRNRAELYDVAADVEETRNLASSEPDVCKTMIQSYRDWIQDNNYAMSYLTIAPCNISHPSPAPEGEVLEVRATQTAAINKPERDGVFIRFSEGTGWDTEYDAYVHPGDRVEFDILVGNDSDIVKGCFYNPGNGWRPFFQQGNGLNQHGTPLVDLTLPKGVWTRQVVGIGNYCPGTIPVNLIALQSRTPGTYHYYLDNIVIRRRDGGTRSVIWASGSDSAPLLYRYKNRNHHSLAEAQAVAAFPFSDIRITTVNAPKAGAE
jgi:hypothetical protein